MLHEWELAEEKARRSRRNWQNLGLAGLAATALLSISLLLYKEPVGEWSARYCSQLDCAPGSRFIDQQVIVNRSAFNAEPRVDCPKSFSGRRLFTVTRYGSIYQPDQSWYLQPGSCQMTRF